MSTDKYSCCCLVETSLISSYTCRTYKLSLILSFRRPQSREKMFDYISILLKEKKSKKICL